MNYTIRSNTARLVAITALAAAVAAPLVNAEESVAASNITAIYQPAAAFTPGTASAVEPGSRALEDKIREWRDPTSVSSGVTQSATAQLTPARKTGDVAMQNIRSIFTASTSD